ncbi:MAG TPA: flagellin [Ilumatobacteraceae bacterium]|nr:flagellin [Ilumatobacteraceae bacterium]
MRINQNVMAANANRNLSNTNIQLGKSLEKLSSGFRINRAADDAAGLVISQGLRAQTSGLRQATRNAQDGISVVQTAEGSLNEVHTMLTRMRDLAVQSANSGANDSAARGAAQTEISALATEISRVSTSARFGGVNLLDGTYGVGASTQAGAATAPSGAGDLWSAMAAGSEFDIAINGGAAVTVDTAGFTGSSASMASQFTTAINAALTTAGNVNAGKVTVSAEYNTTLNQNFTGAADTAQFTISVDGLQAGEGFVTSADTTSLIAVGITAAAATNASGAGGTFQIGANAGEVVSLNIGNTSASTLGVGSLDVTTDSGSALAITALDEAISSVSTTRGELGALQNRFESMITNLQVTTENLAASESRIRDTDMAAEMVTFTKNNVLLQAGTAMLAQANQVPQSILSLLR